MKLQIKKKLNSVGNNGRKILKKETISDKSMIQITGIFDLRSNF